MQRQDDVACHEIVGRGRNFLRNRELLGDLSRAAWETVRAMMAEAAGDPGVRPGMVVVPQTFGSSVNAHPHVHAIASGGGWTTDGTWVPVPYWFHGDPHHQRSRERIQQIDPTTLEIANIARHEREAQRLRGSGDESVGLRSRDAPRTQLTTHDPGSLRDRLRDRDYITCFGKKAVKPCANAEVRFPGKAEMDLLERNDADGDPLDACSPLQDSGIGPSSDELTENVVSVSHRIECPHEDVGA